MIVFSASFLGVVVVEARPITRSFISGQPAVATAGRMLLAMLVARALFA